MAWRSVFGITANSTTRRQQYLAAHTWLAASPFELVAPPQGLRRARRQYLVGLLGCALLVALWRGPHPLLPLLLISIGLGLEGLSWRVLVQSIRYRRQHVEALPEGARRVSQIPAWVLTLGAGAWVQWVWDGQLTGGSAALAAGVALTGTGAFSLLRQQRRELLSGLSFAGQPLRRGAPRWELLPEWGLSVLVPAALFALGDATRAPWLTEPSSVLTPTGHLLLQVLAVAAVFVATASRRVVSLVDGAGCGPLKLRLSLGGWRWALLVGGALCTSLLSLGLTRSWFALPQWRLLCAGLRARISTEAPADTRGVCDTLQDAARADP